MNLDIILGITQRKTARRLLWNQSNGLIVAGGSGSGKSQTACWYATQYALKGCKIVLGEYSAYSVQGEGLVDRCDHLRAAFYYPPARTAEDVIEYIHRLKALADIRLDPEKGKTVQHFPLVCFLDEFSALMLDYKKDMPVDKLRSMAMTIRKANMKMVILGQSWSQLQNEIPQMRNAFDHVVIHRISALNVKVFDPSSRTAQQVVRLDPGYALKDGDLMYVPSRMSDKNLEYARKKLTEIHPPQSIDDLLEALLMESIPDRQTEGIEITENVPVSNRLSDINIDDKRDLIAFLHSIGKNYSEIRDLVRGDNNTLRPIYDEVIKNDNNDI